MTESPGLHETLKCMICLDFADQAVETTCCHHVGCQKCLEPMQKCPTCQKESFEVQPAILLRRVIANLPAVCPNEECAATTTKGELEPHLKICQVKLLQCPSEKCDFKAEKGKVAQHIVEKHPERNLQYVVSGLEAETLEKAKCFLSPCKEELSQPDFWRHLQDNHAEEIKPFVLKNRAGVQVKIGTNGKFYCDRENIVYSYDASKYKYTERYKQNQTCDSYHGNCSECMELDLIFRGLKCSVPLKLINREGRVCLTNVCTHTIGKSFSGAQVATVPLICGKDGCHTDPVFYCGQYVNNDICRVDGRICSSCSEIGKLQKKMYTSVWD